MTTEIESIVKAMSHLAWADGRLDPREEEMTYKLFLRLGLTEQEARAALKQDAAARVNLPELATVIPTAAGRQKLVKMLLELSFVDDALTFEEFSIVESVTQVFQMSDKELDAIREDILNSR